MTKSSFFEVLAALILYFAVYLTDCIFKIAFWGDILAPIGGMASAGIIFYFHRKTDTAKKAGRNWIHLNLACLSWAVADTLWAVYRWVLCRNPDESNLISAFYLGTNIFLLAAILTQTVHDFKIWSAIRLFVDSIAVSASSLFFLWIMFLDKRFPPFGFSGLDGWITVVSIISDMAAVVCITVWYCSIHGGKIPLHLNITMLSILFYFTVDLYWYYQYLNNQYIPDSALDAAYMASLLGIAVGVMARPDSSDGRSVQSGGYSNVGIRQTGLLLLFCPVLEIILKGFVLADLLVYLFIILVYEVLSVYIQSSIKVQDQNLELEKKIAERTEELAEKNRQLHVLSNQDTVTNLSNRRCFIHQLESEITELSSGEALALLLIDLDRFKIINDTYGHDVGDMVLIEMAKRLQRIKKDSTLLPRLGGDEFVFAVRRSRGDMDLKEIAQRIIEECGRTIQVYWYSFHVTASVGISVYPLDAANMNTLMKNADIAMYQAKKLGNNRFFFFDEQLSNAIERKNEIEILLKKVDFDKEFMVFYQPQFSVPDKKLIGMEALLRWNSPQKGFIPPNEFIPIAEETDDILLIGGWVMKKAVAQITAWNRTYGLKMKMAINVSPKQLDQTNFFLCLQSVIKDYSAEPAWIDAEITEGMAMKGNTAMAEIARKFRQAGVTISIDDFGMGYSSLGYLKLFPFNRIKIDKSLIDEITTDPYDQNIVKFTTLLAQSLGVETLAEGVETQEQFDLLAGLGCEQIQGYFLGKPMPAAEFEKQFLLKKD